MAQLLLVGVDVDVAALPVSHHTQDLVRLGVLAEEV